MSPARRRRSLQEPAQGLREARCLLRKATQGPNGTICSPPWHRPTSGDLECFARQLADESGLSHTGFAQNRDQLTVPCFGIGHGVTKAIHCGLTSDQSDLGWWYGRANPRNCGLVSRSPDSWFGGGRRQGPGAKDVPIELPRLLLGLHPRVPAEARRRTAGTAAGPCPDDRVGRIAAIE